MRRRPGIRCCFLALVATIALGALPAAAGAQGPPHIDGNPLAIHVDGLGRLQFRFVGQDAGTFYSPYDDSANAGLEIVEGATAYPLGASRTVDTAPALSGTGGEHQLTSAYKVGPNLKVTERIAYTDGTQVVDVSYDIANVSDGTVSFRAAELADLYVGNSDYGRGFLIDQEPRFVGGWSPDGTAMGIEERTPWAHFEEGRFYTVFANFQQATLADRVEPTLVDNGVGVAWADTTLEPSGTASFSLRWRIGADSTVNTTVDGDDGVCTTEPGGCTLREALAHSAQGDLVTVPAGDYPLSEGALAVDRDLTILGGGADATTIHPTGLGRVLSIQAGASVSLSGVTITGGDAGALRGGGILVDAEAVLHLSDAAVVGNTAGAGGGILSAGSLQLVRTTVAHNRAVGTDVPPQGAGLYLPSGTASLENSTVSNNVADDKGGGIYTRIGLDLTNVTIADNVAGDGVRGNGGGLYQEFDGDQRTLAMNTLVARNGGGSCAGTDDHPIQSSYGLSDEATTPANPLGPTCTAAGTGILYVANAGLGALAGNGGPTQTHAPQSGSPAIDAGNPELCPELDQRGFPRPEGLRCDIGAVEGEEAPATLAVFTEVVNDNGGSATASDFTVRVLRGSQDATDPLPGDGSEGQEYRLPAGVYRVSANPRAGYALTMIGECDANGTITLQPEDFKGCTIIADDVAAMPATLKVVTRVVNDSGGTRGAGDFTVHVRRGGGDVSGSPRAGSAAGTTYTLAAGTYGVAAAAPVGYTAAIGGDCAPTGAITLAAGAVKTCTITGDDKTVNRLVPPPVAGKSVNAVPKSGTVKIKLPGTDAFVLLEEGQQIPVGTIIDTTKGRVTLVAASNTSGGTATAVFYDGIFKVGQTKGAKPVTTLRLVEKLSCGRGNASAAARRKKKRRLWGDGKGRFRTDGKYSAATVVGTKWMVEDRCDSTLTRVARGKVSVRDLVKRKTVIVRAGKTYVAKRRK